MQATDAGVGASEWSGCMAEVYAVLRQHLMPLTRGKPVPEAVQLLNAHTPSEFFPAVSAPGAAMAGLWLAAGDWNQAHDLSQNEQTREGSFWHEIVHRQEPDASNAKYWFRQVGQHPIFEELGAAAREIDARHGSRLKIPECWDPSRFVDITLNAGGTPLEQAAREVQRAEWELLLRYCSRSAES